MVLSFNSKQKSFFIKNKIIAVYLFGSQALGVTHANSDFDYAVLTQDNNHKKGDKLYHSLYDILLDVSPQKKNKLIDVVYLHTVGLELKFHVIRYGKLLYDASPIMRLEFEVTTQKLYCDFKPVLDTFDRAILESL